MVRASLILASLFATSFAHAASPAVDLKGTYTLISQTCDDGTVLPGSKGGTIKITFDGTKMTLTDDRSPGQKISTGYKLDGDKLINTNQRTKAQITSKIEVKDKTMTMTSELPKDSVEALKVCPKGGRHLKSVYTKS